MASHTDASEHPDSAELPGGPDTSSPLRPPQQERSRRTLDRIVRAALELFAERGVERTSIQDIVDRADSSVGSFYARFEGKDALVRYLESRVWEEARERWDEAIAGRSWEELSLETLVEGVVELLVRLHGEDAGRRAALRAAGVPGGSDDPAGAFHARAEDDLSRLILAHRGQLAHPEPERAAAFGYRIVVASLRDLLDGKEGQEGGRDPDTLSRELSRMWMGYLGAEPYGPRRPEGDVDFFDVWG